MSLTRSSSPFTDDDGKSGSSSGSEASDDGDDSEAEKPVDEATELAAPILDKTETNLVALRRTIYLTIQVRELSDAPFELGLSLKRTEFSCVRFLSVLLRSNECYERNCLDRCFNCYTPHAQSAKGKVRKGLQETDVVRLVPKCINDPRIIRVLR